MTDVQCPIGGNLASEHEVADFKLGTRLFGDDNTEWVYCQANGAITQYHAVGIDENYQAASLTDTMASDGWLFGVAQIAFTDDYYGWFCVNGSNVNLLLAAATAVDAPLFVGTVAGVPDGITSVGNKIDGLVNVAAPSTSVASAVEVIMNHPKFGSH